MIEKLHQINQDIIEKDNYINNYMDIIAILETMMKDPEVIKSDAYIDLRTKYLSAIEVKLKTIADLKKIHLEPEAVLKPSATKSRKNLVAREINGPIPTDIFMAPKNRRLPAKKSLVKVNKPSKSQGSNISLKIEDTDLETPSTENHEKEYLEFEHEGQSYYIDNQPRTLGTPPQVTFEIYNDQLELSGNLKGNRMVLLDLDNFDQSQEIEIPDITSDLVGSDELTLSGYLIQN